MWTAGKMVLFRTAILVGMASVVTTIIYFTPVPEQEFMSCDRPCHDIEMPMICRLKLILEPYRTLTRSCSDCPRNSTDCLRKHCISGDGVRRNVLTANRQIPGPNIHVCENDIMVVDVVNRMPGREVTLHWRGQPVTETPFMDGVPMITQCPIPSATTFQYKFRASRAGTHLWQAVTGGEVDGLVGALVVRQPESRTLERALYSVDDVNHVVVVNAWRGDDAEEALLINGRTHVKKETEEFPPSVFTVRPGQRHRFRLVHAGGRGNKCPIRISVDRHVMKVIALDGNLIVPRGTDSIELAEGERADVVLHADQTNASYFLRGSTSPQCGSTVLRGVALLRYESETSPAMDVDAADSEAGTRMTTGACARQEDVICVDDVEAIHKLPEELRGDRMDNQIYLFFGYKSNKDSNSLQSLDDRVAHINNVTFMYPSSPLLTQPDDVNPDLLCSEGGRPPRCADAHLCECVHVLDVALHSTVELVLVDQGGSDDASHVFHLHGHRFHVVAVSQLPRHVTDDEVKAMDGAGVLLTRNLLSPVVKDTVTVPRNGVAALRFTADSPGYWLLESDRSRRMSIVLHVGQRGDLPRVPVDYPKCGSWVGPDFFLI